MNRNVNYAENSVKVYRYFEFYEAINVNISRLSLSLLNHIIMINNTMICIDVEANWQINKNEFYYSLASMN